MFQKFRILPFLMLFLLLVSCGPASKSEPQSPSNKPTETATEATEPPMQESTPNDEQIKDDLQASLTENTYFVITITDCTLNKSLTEDRSFSAELSVTAQSTYAEFFYTADIDYTLYDQGWMMDSCNWSSPTYEVIKYPTEAEMPALASVFDESLANYTCTDIIPDGDVISVTFEASDYSRNYISFPYISRIRPWYYDSLTDEWFASESDYEITETTFALKPELAGVWEDLDGGQYVISNVTDTGFDISCDAPMITFESAHIDCNEMTTYDNGTSALECRAYTSGSANDKWSSGRWLHDKTITVSVSLSSSTDRESLTVVSFSSGRTSSSTITAGSALKQITVPSSTLS